MRSRLALIGTCLATGFAATGTSRIQTICQMQWHRRVLLIAAPASDDPGLVAQAQALNGWRSGAADRDLTTVEIAGHTVTGSSDTAAALRAKYRLPTASFMVVLIGKDGHVAIRSFHPIAPATLAGIIDAMPMRRAGRR
jgi:hypothetical protein